MRVCVKTRKIASAISIIVIALITLANVAVAQQVPITITPSPPPGISEPIQRLLSWLMWIGWIIVAGAFIVGAIHFVMGDTEKAKKYIIGAIVGAIIMAFYTAIITGLIS